MHSFIPLFTKISLTPHTNDIIEMSNNAKNLLTKKIPINDKLAINKIKEEKLLILILLIASLSFIGINKISINSNK